MSYLKSRRKEKKFFFISNKEEQLARVATIPDMSKWHNRSSHYNVRGKMLATPLRLFGPYFKYKLPLYVECQHGNLKKKSSPKNALKAARNHELVCSDLSRPHKSLALGDFIIYDKFIEYYMRRSWNFSMKQKSVTFKNKLESQRVNV